jgi:hypothetical protein
VLRGGQADSVFYSLPPWVLDAAIFVGELLGYEENRINQLLQDYRFSEAVRKRKREIINGVKDDIKKHQVSAAIV